MYLSHLSLINFKNHGEFSGEFVDGVNCFVGNNGVGKTNLLDAVYYLSFLKSFFNPIDTQNILHEADFMMVQGNYTLADRSEKIDIGLKRGQKKVCRRNGKVYSRLADHIGLLPLVMVSPADSTLITEGSDLRRKFVDGVIAQYDRRYLEHLLHYNKALANRNALLKQFAEQRYFDAESLQLWDMKLSEYAAPVFDGRQKFLEEFIPIFRKYYEIISGGVEEVSLEYDSQLHAGSLDDLLRDSLQKDLAARYTTVGIHKDDLGFLLEQHSVKKFGSQGQQKTYLLALKLAQFDLIKGIKGFKPILLLDDIFDKLDKLRIKTLMHLVSAHNFGQIFITDANKERVHDLFEDIDTEPKVFNLE